MSRFKFTIIIPIAKPTIITPKKTKVTKSGETMAFITLEDRYGEIGVIVFARQYKLCSEQLFVDNAVSISGSIACEEGEAPEIILSAIAPLRPDTDSSVKAPEAGEENSLKDSPKRESPKGQRLFIKVKGMNDERIRAILRLAMLNPGDAAVVLYDTETGKYSAMKDLRINPTDKVLARLCEMFSAENVVLR